MLKATEKALRASIRHWEKDGPKDMEMTGEDCALCRRFCHAHNAWKCIRSPRGRPDEKCPVFTKTGRRECVRTPFSFYPTLRQVKAEIKFLKSLLPTVKK